jgi:stage V sporulation protein T
MKTTGIVRRIDELGRVVIPKETRRNLRIKEGDPLELYITKDGELVLKKYSPVGECEDEVKRFVELARTLNIRLGVYHRDSALMLGTDTEIPNAITIGDNYNQITNTITFDSRACPCYCIKDDDNDITAYVIMYSPEENAVSKGQVFALTKMLEKIIKNT